MNSMGTGPGIESELIDLDEVPFAKLSELGGETFHQSMNRVVERTRHLRAPYRSSSGAAGERVD
jgi:hypothetical protein